MIIHIIERLRAGYVQLDLFLHIRTYILAHTYMQECVCVTHVRESACVVHWYFFSQHHAEHAFSYYRMCSYQRVWFIGAPSVTTNVCACTHATYTHILAFVSVSMTRRLVQ